MYERQLQFKTTNSLTPIRYLTDPKVIDTTNELC